MAHPKEIRDAVRRAYVFDRLTLEIAAMKAGVSYGTARRWKADAAETGDDWDRAQSAQLIAGGTLEDIARGVLAGLVTQYQSTMEELSRTDDVKPLEKTKLLASLADSFQKTVSASKKILPETNELAIAMDVLQRLAAWVKNNKPEHIQIFAEMLEPFGVELSRAYG
ncbi:DUF1804 family protein [Cupriavidus sp. 30B13]|uniref:DUF1804 family protein n=1 Tax=Cupriavidus sp. 30B13 TaxID=3384241 RepID=UPI003B90F905